MLGDLGFRVKGLGFRVCKVLGMSGIGFRVYKVYGLGIYTEG